MAAAAAADTGRGARKAPKPEFGLGRCCSRQVIRPPPRKDAEGRRGIRPQGRGQGDARTRRRHRQVGRPHQTQGCHWSSRPRHHSRCHDHCRHYQHHQAPDHLRELKYQIVRGLELSPSLLIYTSICTWSAQCRVGSPFLYYLIVSPLFCSAIVGLGLGLSLISHRR